ncbi:MAG TPA: isoleucine--tRNA ligase [Kiritimatiellia bacterium]|nr:isoleucine--tRNA ligase [Kiritimatiellia bacterium]HMO98338.1 isoleucine--tRNA ligase [Kiritimatiellia bacterium]HMP95466.1 isoleucine--tRNA ligase [Kiritimatiellia bacterium]
MFKPVSNKINFPVMEEEILSFWETESIFTRSLRQREATKPFVFYDGPPFATGRPHYGHLLAGTIKDIIPRYMTMRGHFVERRFGWDCHGLPIEALAQEALGLAGAAAIKEAGVDVFNEQCRSMVLTYVNEWRKTVSRMGRWVDFDRDYKTMDLSFMETIWWVFKQLWDQGRIYRAYRIMPYSWKLTTPLSNFEANSNYKNVQDPDITVRLRVAEPGGPSTGDAPVYALVWTTTPWTLPSNLAVCVGPEIDYVIVADVSSGERYLLASARLSAYFKKEDDYQILKTIKGADLAGWTYEPLFDYFRNQPGAFRFLVDAFVSTEDGTGIVHLAPAYGEDDYRICRAAGIDLVDPLDEECRFTEGVPEYRGQFCKDADKAIIKRLKEEGKLVRQGTLVHSYPFCERTDTPLIYRAIDAWYLRVEDLRDALTAQNDTIYWMPGYVGEKRFGNWLKDAKDWNISRNRFWGSCIPVWIAEDGSDMVCVGSIAELEALSGEVVTDLHKHIVDKITFVKNGKRYRRTPEVLDCWFESGSMPYAQHHYPFERADDFETCFPADFIAEGLDQTRGWFYTLLIISTALFKKSAFRNVVVNGLVLAEDGRKMSKRLKNYPDPNAIMDAHGADALRLYMINSPVVRAEDLCFSEAGVVHSLRHLLIPLWNAYSFLVTYARIDGWTPEKSDGLPPSEHVLDRWILSAMERLNEDVVKAMDAYDLQSSVKPFVRFIEDLTNWYIRRSRRRFWKSSNDNDKLQAYRTLYDVLLRLSKIAAPFVPFISEAIYRNLRTHGMPESVHVCDFPVGTEGGRDLELEARMAAVLEVVELGRQLRTEHNLKVRQPLASMHIVSHKPAHVEHAQALQELILDELNVKSAHFSRHESALASLSAKANFKALGKRIGGKVQKVNQAVMKLDGQKLDAVLSGNTLELDIDGETIVIGPDDLVIDRKPREGLAVSAGEHFVIALDTKPTPELLCEGLAREFVNKVQNVRKTADFDIAQRIHVRYDGDPAVIQAVQAHHEYIANEVLAVTCEPGIDEGWGVAESLDLNGHAGRVAVKPVSP